MAVSNEPIIQATELQKTFFDFWRQHLSTNDWDPVGTVRLFWPTYIIFPLDINRLKEE